MHGMDEITLFRWQGTDVDEIGIDEATGKVRIQVDPKYYRPTEVVSTLILASKYNSPRVYNHEVCFILLLMFHSEVYKPNPHFLYHSYST